MKYFSMFSGIGGFELGIKQAYESKISYIIFDKDIKRFLNEAGIFQSKIDAKKWFESNGLDYQYFKIRKFYHDNNNRTKQTTQTKNISKHSTSSSVSLGNGRKFNPTCIGYSEIDKYAIQVYEKHFNHKNYGSATTIKPTELPDFDLLVGGFPCQAFSIAGKRGGFKDTRGTLFFDIAKVLKAKRPKNFVLENVKGLLSHDKGNTFATIIGTIIELGYDCQWSVLNSKNFGVPQNRERVFIVGHLRGTSRPKVFPISGGSQKDTRDVIQTNLSKESGGQQPYQQNRTYDVDGLSPALPAELGGDRNHLIEITQDKPISQRIYDSGGIAKTLKGLGGGQGAKTGLYMINLHQKRTGERGDGTKQLDDVSFTLDTGSGRDLCLTDNTLIRRLTPTECERLQGFPDGWTEGVSDTQRYKVLGNAVTTNVVQAIMEKLI